MMILFFLIRTNEQGEFDRLEWQMWDNDGPLMIEAGNVSRKAGSYIHDLIQFLLKVGQSKYIISYKTENELKLLGKAMKNTGYFQVSVKLMHELMKVDVSKVVDIPPTTLREIYLAFFKNEALLVEL